MLALFNGMDILIRRNRVKSAPPTSVPDTTKLAGHGLTNGTFRLKVTFIDKDGDSHTFEVAKGDNLLDIAQANDLEMEGEFNTPAPIPVVPPHTDSSRRLRRLLRLQHLPRHNRRPRHVR